MKFRTEIRIAPFAEKIGYRSRLLLLGSCFADEMREKLRSLKFRASGNFSGPLFNPASIAAALRRAQRPEAAGADELHRGAGGEWFHYATDTRADGADPQAVLDRVNSAQTALHRALAECDTLLVTFGTAWIYRLRATGEVVANCHKQPQALFERQRLTIHGIVAEWSELLSTLLASKRVILTVSPVRHTGEGLEDNCLSKSLLRVAAAELAERFGHVDYFPAYEILTDDLRDYRFYADDLVHPSRQAVEYIWEKFSEAAIDAPDRELIPQVMKILKVRNHKPLQPHSEAYRTLCARTMEAARNLEETQGIDFSEEIDCFRRILSV